MRRLPGMGNAGKTGPPGLLAAAGLLPAAEIAARALAESGWALWQTIFLSARSSLRTFPCRQFTSFAEKQKNGFFYFFC